MSTSSSFVLFMKSAPAPSRHSRAIVISSLSVALTPRKQFGSTVTKPLMTTWAGTKQEP